MIIHKQRPSVRPTEQDLLNYAIDCLRQADNALSRLTGIVEEVPYADWYQVGNALPIEFTRFLLTTESATLERRIKALEAQR